MIEHLLPGDSPLRQPHFQYGVATSSFQIEGATEVDGRQDSIWDAFCRQPGCILDASDGAQACEHYQRFGDDIQLIKSLGFDHYRLSLAWPRLITEGGKLNDKGVDFYRRLLETCHAHGVQPNVTLYHWDLPSSLTGGWLNRDTAFRFADYAALVNRALGDLMPRIATLNEPWCSSILSYDIGAHAPGHTDRAEGLRAAHHLMLASGLGLQAMRAERSDQSLGLVLNFEALQAKTGADQVARDLAHAERVRFWMDRLYDRSPDEALMAQGGDDERPGDRRIMAEPLDWLGVNYYTRSVVTADGNQRGYECAPEGATERTHIGWDIYPRGLTDILVELNQDYPLPPVYITENGAACDDHLIDGQVQDEQRIRYFQGHLKAVHDAVQQGVDVRGYYAWSLMDNFEWAFGYTQRFGLVYVDYPTQARIPKASAKAWQAFLSNR